MKVSKYNIFLSHETGFFTLNQLSGSILELNEELYLSLKSGNIATIDKEISDKLLKTGILCYKDLEEHQIIISRNRMQRYGNKIARLTIMPTINCNFRCWYCYEEHVESIMSETTIESIVLFAQKLIEDNKLHQFHLDWFGGEPLLHFYNIVYPLSKKIKNLCDENHIVFVNSITTNGYMVNADMISLLNEIELKTYQITLDGEKSIHNRTRHTEKDFNTYDKIINNIELLCHNISDVKMSVRINYTVQNIKTIEKIADSFNANVRHMILISPHIVWQHSNKIPDWERTIESKMAVFRQKGYMIKEYVADPRNCIGCYVENMLQFVVNYDAKVYKCTARDFKKNNAIGEITANGNFIPTPLYFKYYSTNSAFERKECLECNYLPSCHASCVQKIIEGNKFVCRKSEIEKNIFKRLENIINKKRLTR